MSKSNPLLGLAITATYVTGVFVLVCLVFVFREAIRMSDGSPFMIASMVITLTTIFGACGFAFLIKVVEDNESEDSRPSGLRKQGCLGDRCCKDLSGKD